MEHFDIDGTPFSVLMDQAVKIKSSQLAPARQKYDAMPCFVQSSIFPSDEVTNARNLESFTKRFDAAMTWKEEGNAAYREGRFDDALEKYKMSLAVFRYVENTNPNIKNEGIKDEYLREIMYVPKSNEEGQQVQHFLVKVYNNLALTSLKRNDNLTAMQACNCAIEIDRANDKSFYLRAQARLAPKSASATDEELAMMDLNTAIAHNPNNKQARKQFQELRLRIRTQRSKDKNTFAGLFNRGEVYDTQELEEEKAARQKCRKNDRIQCKNQDVILGQRLAQLYDERGMIEERTKIEENLKSMTVRRDQVVNDVDFRNPTANMVQEAKTMGVDLSDPQTLEMLEQMQRERKGENVVCYSSEQRKNTNTSAATITAKYSWTRILNIFRGATMLCVMVFVYIRLLNTFLHNSNDLRKCSRR
jgi:tetratricopeptide (TPR) repeat protein